MKTVTLLAAAATMFSSLGAQEHLEPEVGPLAHQRPYHSKVAEAFGAAKKGKVICQVIVLASFEPEQSIGIRESDTGYEVFRIRPSSMIWNTELVRLYQSGEIKSLNLDGTARPLHLNESYQRIKKSTPDDFRKIPLEVNSMEITPALTKRVRNIWKHMLLGVRQPEEVKEGQDGTSYHFSMMRETGGIISGQIWSPDRNTKTAALAELVGSLSMYVDGHFNAELLTTKIARVEKRLKSAVKRNGGPKRHSHPAFHDRSTQRHPDNYNPTPCESADPFASDQ